MDIYKNTSLKEYNTFRVDVNAKYLALPKSIEEIREILNEYRNEKILLLGGGSNILFTKDWDGLVIKPELKGINIVNEDEEKITLEVASGEVWDDFVRYTVAKDYAGIESMVMIPGTVGGGSSQNIGAYGEEICNVIEEIKVIDIETLEEKIFKTGECGYGYRKSNFKNIWMNRYIITSTVFQLEKNAEEYKSKYSERAGRYTSLKEELAVFGKEPYSIENIMEAVIEKRKKILPLVEEYGTAGSFFANPVITKQKFNELSEIIEGLPSYPADTEEYVKIPAGKLLEELGWKGKKIGNVGTFEKHALCVITNMNASGEEVLDYIKQMQESVKENYGVELKPEVNIIL